MSKNPLAVVCALAFLAGGAAAGALHYRQPDSAAVNAVARTNDAAGEARAETVPLTVEAAEGAPAEERLAAGAADETADGAEVRDGVEDGRGVTGRRAYRRAGGLRDESDARPRAARRYTTVSRGGGGVGGVGRGVAGHTVRGVKKTGAAIGKTFGKIGGVFHD